MWTARRLRAGTPVRLRTPPEHDEFNRPMQMFGKSAGDLQISALNRCLRQNWDTLRQ